MKRILIVDDSAEVREYLSKLLKSIEGIQLAGEAEDYVSAIDNFKKLNPQAVILDIDLRVENGIKVLTELKRLSPSTIVIMFTNYTNHILKNLAIKQGADFFLDKSNDIDKLINILTNLAD